MNELKSVNSEFNLYKKIENISEYYSFFDNLTEKLLGTSELKIRQIIDKEDLKTLSQGRERMYGQREEYFSSLYEGEYLIDEMDLNSYLFACFYKGEIIGIQRAAHFPFEVANHINAHELTKFLGKNYKDDVIEFSRLVVDKNTKFKGLANVLGFVTGSLVAIHTGKDQYITYSKPQLKRKSVSFDDEYLPFHIVSREEIKYELYKGSLTKNINSIFNVKGDTPKDTIDNFKEKILASKKQLQGA